MLQLRPEMRCSAKEALNHPWFQDLGQLQAQQGLQASGGQGQQGLVGYGTPGIVGSGGGGVYWMFCWLSWRNV
jgi:hypothetical protein